MSDEKFTWDSQDDVVFPTVQAVAVYKNTAGDVVIRQQAGTLDDDDTFVILPVVHLQALIAKLQQVGAE